MQLTGHLRPLTFSVVLAAVLAVCVEARVYRSFIDKYTAGKSYVPRSRGYRFSNVPYSRSRSSGTSNLLRGGDGSYLIPLEELVLDLAGYTGHTMGKVPNIMRGIKHEMYIGKHNQDPMLREILRRYGFTFTGTPLGGIGGVAGGTQDIFNSLGVGGVSSVQTPLPGMNTGTAAINDDLFNDNSVLGLS